MVHRAAPPPLSVFWQMDLTKLTDQELSAQLQLACDESKARPSIAYMFSAFIVQCADERVLRAMNHYKLEMERMKAERESGEDEAAVPPSPDYDAHWEAQAEAAERELERRAERAMKKPRRA